MVQLPARGFTGNTRRAAGPGAGPARRGLPTGGRARARPDLDPGSRADTLAREKAYSQDLQRQGKWPHIWRIVGQYANLSVFDVSGTDELHEILWNLPLFPYMAIEVTPLTHHPSDISPAER